MAVRTTNTTDSWVQEAIQHLFTKAYESLLAHGPNYAITPKHSANGEKITAVKQLCQNWHKEVKEIRVKIRGFSNVLCPTSNITRGEEKALKEVTHDKSQVILLVNKGVGLVVSTNKIV